MLDLLWPCVLGNRAGGFQEAGKGSIRASPTFSSGGVLLLQDDPLSIQTRYGGAEVKGLFLSTLEAKIVC